MFFIAYTFKGQVHDIVFAGREKIADAISSGGGGDPGDRFRSHLCSQCFDHYLQWVDIGHYL